MFNSCVTGLFSRELARGAIFLGVSGSPFSTFPSPEAITHRKQVEEKKFFGKLKKHNCVERADEELILISLHLYDVCFLELSPQVEDSSAV